jgi:uncharacterized protein YdeI (BOF family)
MNLRFVFAAVVFGVFLVPFTHAEGGSGDYPRMTLAEAVKQPDETKMSIEGQFLNRHKGEEDEFLFQDAAGESIVVYDSSKGRDITLNKSVIINGEIDKGLIKTEFNLHSVSKGD